MLKASDFPRVVVLISDKPASLFPNAFYFEGMGRHLKPYLGRNLKHLLCDFKNGEVRYCVEPSEWREMGEVTYSKIRGDKRFFKRVYEDVVAACEEMVAAAEAARKADYSQLSREQALELYEGFGAGMTKVTSSGLVFSFVDAINNLLTKDLEGLLREKLSPCEAMEAFNQLTTPVKESFLKKEKKSLLKLAVAAKKKIANAAKLEPEALLNQLEKNAALKESFEKHFEAFFWIPYNYEGPAFTKLDVARMVLEHLKSGEDLEKQLRALEDDAKTLQKKQAELEAKLGLNSFEKYLFECAREMVFLKGYRKDMAFKSYCFMEEWLVAVGKILGLTLKEMRLLSPRETRELLRGGAPPNLSKRYAHYVYVFAGNEINLFEGQEAKAFSSRVIEEKVAVHAKEIRGTCACPGAARGVVKIVNEIVDLPKMRVGDVLVSLQTNPNLMPALAKASAIVTDTGGITCHAAVVARELQKPCVIGTRVATKWLKDGDEVDVDATKGVVRKVK